MDSDGARRLGSASSVKALIPQRRCIPSWTCPLRASIKACTASRLLAGPRDWTLHAYPSSHVGWTFALIHLFTPYRLAPFTYVFIQLHLSPFFSSPRRSQFCGLSFSTSGFASFVPPLALSPWLSCTFLAPFSFDLFDLAPLLFFCSLTHHSSYTPRLHSHPKPIRARGG